MVIEAADLREEDLALHVDSGGWIGARLDQQRHLFELAPDRRVGKDGRERRIHTAQRVICLNRARTRVARGFHEFEIVVDVVNAIDALLLHGTMHPQMRASIITAMNAINDTNITTRHQKRARTAVYLVATSSQYDIQR